MDAVLDIAFKNPIATAVSDVYKGLSNRRAKLGLSNPGSVEKIAKEVQNDVFLSNLMFTGLRADINKAFSISPLFQVSHQFFIGERLSPYTFAALYGTNKVQKPLVSQETFTAAFPRLLTGLFFLPNPRYSCKEV